MQLLARRTEGAEARWCWDFDELRAEELAALFQEHLLLQQAPCSLGVPLLGVLWQGLHALLGT